MSWCLSRWQGEPVRVAGLQAQEVSLALRRPLVTAKGTYEARRIVVISCDVQVGEERARGVGEAAPLPGWTRESVQDCMSAARKVKPGSAKEVLEGLEAISSLYGAVEMAILDGMARVSGVSLRTLLVDLDGGQGATVGEIAVQATLGAMGVEETVSAVKEWVQRGWTTVKLKVGVGTVENDIERIRAVCRAVEGLSVRVDANGAWSLEQAQRFLRTVEGVELVEQPVAVGQREGLIRLAEQFPGVIAADESVTDAAEGGRLLEDGLSALVVKPGALGGIWRTRELMKECLSRGRTVVLSNLIESALGRRAVAELAASLPDAVGPHGLSTGTWLAEDFGEADRVEAGVFSLDEGPGIGVSPEVFEGGRR